MLEPVDEAWCGCDEVSGAGCDDPFGLQLGREGVADPLQPGGVTSRGDQRGDAGVAQDIERRVCLAG